MCESLRFDDFALDDEPYQESPDVKEPRKAPAPPQPPLAAGDWVAIGGVPGVIARVVEIDPKRARARVELNDRQWLVPLAKLSRATPEPPDPRRRKERQQVYSETPVYYEIDLHGQYVEEALVMAERGLDQAIVNHLDRFKLIHGHGSGRVRQAIRKMLGSHPHVESYRFGEPQEGGLGCTVAILRQPK